MMFWINVAAHVDDAAVWELYSGSGYHNKLVARSTSLGGPQLSDSSGSLGGGEAFAPNTWRHVAVTMTTGPSPWVNLYVDGSMQSNGSILGVGFTSKDTMQRGYLGASLQSSPVFLNARLRDFRVYSGELSGDKISSIYSVENSNLPQYTEAVSGAPSPAPTATKVRL